MVAYMQEYNSKICIALKNSLRIDWKFGNKLILSISTELCDKNRSQDHKINIYQSE